MSSVRARIASRLQSKDQFGLATTLTNRDLALSHPNLAQQLEVQRTSQSVSRLLNGSVGSPEAPHNSTHTAEDSKHDLDKKNNDDVLHPDSDEMVVMLKYELAVSRAQARSFQESLDKMTAMVWEMKRDKESEDKVAKEKEKEQRELKAVKEKHDQEMRELDRDKKSSCDQQRMKSMVDGYIKLNGRLKDTEGYERKFLPYMDAFKDQENTPMALTDLNGREWTPINETILEAKKRKELYYLLTNIVDETTSEKLESTIRESSNNDAQAVWRKLSKLLRRGETEGEGKSCLQALLLSTMLSTRKTISGYGGEITRYQNLMVELGMPQSEEKMLIPLYFDGLASALKDVKTYVQTKVYDGEITLLADVMKECESKAKDKGLQNFCVKSQNSLEIKDQSEPKSKADKRKDKKSKQQETAKKKETEDLKKQLSVAVAMAQQNYSKTVGSGECRFGSKAQCPRDDCKFTHNGAGGANGKNRNNSDRKDTWCGDCNKKTNHSTEEHGKCWTCGEKGHRNFQCPKKTGAAKGGKTTLFAGSQAVQQVEVDGQTWVAFQGNLRVKVPTNIVEDAAASMNDMEKPIFVLPLPALSRMGEILTCYTSTGEKAGPTVSVSFRVPQPKKKHKKAGNDNSKKRRTRKEKTQKVSKKSKVEKKRGKVAKEKRCKMKQSCIRRKKLRMRSRRNPAASWTKKKFFKLEWNRKMSRNQRRKASRRERSRRQSRMAVVKVTQEEYKKRNVYLKFKAELVEEIASRKKWKVKAAKNKMLIQFKTQIAIGLRCVLAASARPLRDPETTENPELFKQMVQTIQYVQSTQQTGVSTILDSGAMVNSGCSKKSKMDNLTRLSGPVEVLGCTGVSTPVTHSGEWTLPTHHPKHDLTLQNVLDVPGSHQNLISVGCLDDAGMKIVFENQTGKVYAPDGGLLLVFEKVNGLYVLTDKMGKEYKVSPQHVIQWEVSNLLSAHETLNHEGFNKIRALLNFPPESLSSPNPVCTSCLNASLVHGNKVKEGLRAAPRYGYRLHSDTSRKLPASNVFGQTGIQRFQLTGDEFTGTLWLDLMHRKSDAKRAVVARIDKINNELGGNPVVEHQSDSGKEYLNKWLDSQLKRRKVEPRNSTPYQQHENGWIEARMKRIQNGAGAMMWRGKAPIQDYAYALRHWIYLNDMMPNAVTGISPYEKRVGIPSGLKPNKVQGKLFCAVYAKLYVHDKLQKDAVKCIYLGKDPRSNGVLVRQIGGKVSGLLVRSGQAVKFLPDEFPYANPQVPRPEPIAGYNFDSDSDYGEDDINLKSDEDEVVSEDESDAESSEGKESEVETEDDAEELQDEVEEKQPDAKKKTVKKQSLIEPEDVEEAADGDIDGEDAWEVKEISDERKRKIGNKRYTQYKVVWAGDFPDQWLVKSRVRAPAAVKAWEEKKKSIKQSLTMITRRYCQLNMCIDPVTPEVLKDEGNPFKSLFDPSKEKRPENPVGYKKMMQHQFADYFVQALIKEKLENLKWRAYVEVPRSSVPKGAKILRPMTAYQIKYNASGEIEKFKSRVCLDGSRTVVDEDETYEAIADFGTIRMLLCLATRYDMDIVQTDVKNFFLQARLPADKQYYCEIPDGWAENDPKTHLAKVLAPWYGLKESAKLAGDQLAEVLEGAGMKENPLMPKVFWKWDGDDLIICANHIDDACWISTNMDKLNKTLDKIEEKFALERTYNPTKLLGVEIEYDRKRGMMKLHQGSYNRAKAKELGMQGKKPSRSPGHIPAKIVNPLFPGGNKVQASAEEIRNYQKKIGIQMWALQSDPSSMFTVYQLAKHMLNPQKEHWEAMTRLERYKFSNPEIGIVFRRAANKERLKKGQNLDCLTFFADADLAGDQVDAKSTSGWCVHLGESGMFDWKSKKQTCVCQSSCESEIFANKECTNYAIWIRPALTMMGFTFSQATPIAQDNSSAIATCTGSKHHSRQRHFRMQINLLRDCCNKRLTVYPWVPTKEMKGDLFNKMHTPSEHERLCELNDIYSEGLKYITDDHKMIQLTGWATKTDPTLKVRNQQ